MARIQSEYKNRGVVVVAVNIWPIFSLREWKAYWHRVGGGNAIFAQDKLPEEVFWVPAGATIIIDRQGHEVFRDLMATSYKTLKSAIEKAK